MTSVLAPGHAVDTFPEIMRRVVDAGHEVGYHGYYHENPTKISRETEKKLIQLGLNAFRNQLGVRPLGTALRIWEYSEPTLDLVEEFGFKYDSSLMGRDLQAYHPQRWQIIGRRTTSLVGSAGSSKSLLAGTSMTFRCSPIRTPSAASRTPTRS
jgi:peptidoglycan/xylan/chitin deacetylase (PgdA/CDA1 family)